MEIILIYLAVFAITLTFGYKWQFKFGNSLAELGILSERSLPFIGSGLSLILQRETVIEFFEKMYERFADEK